MWDVSLWLPCDAHLGREESDVVILVASGKLVVVMFVICHEAASPACLM